MHYFEVLVARVHTGRRLFTYSSDHMLPRGSIVRIAYGKKNVLGIVVQSVEQPAFVTRAITETVPYTLPDEHMNLLLWMCQYYTDDFGDIASQFIPARFPKRSPSTKASVHTEGASLPLPPPTTEQQKALCALQTLPAARLLLHGDTGTGKTRVFLEAIKQHVAHGKSALVLTPEIGLTPQLVQSIVDHVPVRVYVTHSNLTEAQRRAIWIACHTSKEPVVCVGPRSATFLPITNIGIVVIDEAHDDSYKQLQSPRYRTLDVATKLASLHKAQLVQSTATPNASDYRIAEQQGYQIVRMTQKAAGAHTGTVELIDTTQRQLFGASYYIADDVIAATRTALQAGQQALFFLNRRGTARSVSCQACGWKPACRACDIALVYHHDRHILQCHSCGKVYATPVACSSCGSTDITYRGLGTKSLVIELTKLFPGARIQRFDADSTSAERLSNHIVQLKRGDVDIIVGTQTITKGLDLPKLAVTCAVQADDGLQFPDYRAEELTYQQLYQLIGRALRGHTASRSFIQTRQPEHDLFQALMSQDWDRFYRHEMYKRQQYLYPPYRHLALCSITMKRQKSAATTAAKAAEQLKQSDQLQVIGPSPSFYEQSPRGYTWHIIAKSRKRSALVRIQDLLGPKWTVDIEPHSLL